MLKEAGLAAVLECRAPFSQATRRLNTAALPGSGAAGGGANAGLSLLGLLLPVVVVIVVVVILVFGVRRVLKRRRKTLEGIEDGVSEGKDAEST